MLSLEVDAVILFSLANRRFHGSGGVVSSLISCSSGFVALLLGTAATASAFGSSTAGGRLAHLAGSRGAAGRGVAALLWGDVGVDAELALDLTKANLERE